VKQFLLRYRLPLLYAVALVVLLLLLQVLQYKLLLVNHAFEAYMLSIALLFTGLGGWLAYTLIRPKTRVETVVVEKTVPVMVDRPVPVVAGAPPDPDLVRTQRQALGLSTREMEVLELMARGMSNQEIADTLFLSVPTVKTHSGRLFEKLEVKRRTQAVERARQLGLIA
jgi:DNA-binding CsgD family transcriptional regulator